MAEPPFLGPQPDFQLISAEFQKMENLPAVAEGNELLRQIQLLNDTFRHGFADTNRRLDILSERIDALNERAETYSNKYTIRDANQTARLQNSLLLTENSPIVPLTNPSTGQVYDRIPSTPQRLNQMSGNALVAVLQGMGIEPENGNDARQQQLKAFLGLRVSS